MNQIGNFLIIGGLIMLASCIIVCLAPDASKELDALNEKPGCTQKIMRIDKKPQIVYECGNKLYFKNSIHIVEIEK